MSDATVLADRVVALLGGLVREDAFPFANDKVGYACIATGGMPQNADDFTSDWRVAGALIESVLAQNKGGNDINLEQDKKDYLVAVRGWTVEQISFGESESLPTAIIEASCDALEAK